MRKNVILIVTLTIILIVSSSCSNSNSETQFVGYVNPLIGTAPARTISALKHGIGSENNSQVIPSVTMPFGMTNWTPQTKSVETKCVAPYYYIDSLISGFRGCHWLSGSCTQDYGSVTIMPISGKLKCLPENRASHYSHAKEISTPYYYKVLLEDYNITSEITATTRAGLLNFTFNDADSGFIVIEPNSDENEGYIKVLPESNEIVGFNPAHRIYQGWGNNAGFSGYFVAKFSKPFSSFGVYQDTNTYEKIKEITNKEKIGAYAFFDLNSSKTIYVEIGTSFTSIENARENLKQETERFSSDPKAKFEQAKELLKNNWEEKLSTVEVESNSTNEKTKFYTALYHCFQQPRIFNDCDGSYPSFDGGKEIKNSGEGNYYADFSVWDTYRASHPLFNMLIPSQSKDMIQSLFLKAEQGGWLPIFPCWNNYTSAMIGDHVISLIADAYVKGIIDLTEEEYQYIKKNALQTPKNFDDYLNGKGRRALKSYMRYGYIPLEDSVKESFHTEEQISRTLEYAFDDFALSQITKKMGKEEDYKYFLNRSKNYKNVYDPTVESVRGKYANGEFTNNFIKTERMLYITEGTPWQYTWYVPHDVEGLISLMGGKDKFNNNLDEFFAAGQYWHGNEPGHQIPFLYTYSGQPEKTQEIVKQILEEEYSSEPGGLSGNDDSGQMSAWYVFAAMGFYPVCPGKDEYAVFASSFESIKIHFENGKTLIVKTNDVSSNRDNPLTIKLNGERIIDNKVSHSKLLEGGILEFVKE